MKKLFYILLFLFPVVAFPQWQWLNPLPTGNNLLSVYFIDSTLGFASGENGTILKTTNGGSTWICESTGISENINSVFFLNAYDGYAAGDNGKIIKTTNGGTTWDTQNTWTNWNLKSIYFTDANTGYAVGYYGVIFKTTNGCETWIFKSSGAYSWAGLNSVFFVIPMLSENAN